MQDGVMKKNKKFRFMIYDYLGRLVVQGLCSLYNHNEKLNDNCVVARFDKGNEGFLNTSYVIPEYFQKSLTNPTLEIVNYYDRNQDSIKGNIKKKFSSIKLSTTVSQIGQLTGCMAMVGSSDYVSKVMVYDIKGNLTQSKMREIGGRIVTHNSSYTFTNNPKYSKDTIDVKYGDKMIVYDSLFYNSYNNKMERHALAISHGDDKATSSISYTYDNLGRTSTLSRPSSKVSYTYDMRGWLKNITTNSFKEDLFYADWTYPTLTKDATVHKCYNGNIAAIRWSNDNYNQVRGYRFVYDKANRLTDALYGERADLNNKTNRYNEVLEYDENGNITNLQRRGLKQDGEYGKIDNLNLKYDGNHLSSVEEDAKDYDYAGSFEYKKLNGTGYKYNENGSLVADKSRGIAYIRYDFNNNPEMIYFTNGNTTEYVYSASGEKLRVIHNTAKYNVITRTVGTEVKGKLDPTLTQYSDTTDYLLGGSLVMKNGKIDKYLFEGGYAQAGPLYSGCVAKPMTFYFEEDEDTTPSSGLVRAEVAAFYFEEDEDTTPSSKKATSSSNNTTSSSNNATTTSVYDEWRKAQEAMHTADYFTFNFYNQDHLGNNREVVDEYGYVSQVTNYYPFGAPYADATAVKDADFQPYKYNGKELDLMHGLNTYDYGARQHDPILARWDRIDPLCEKYYSTSPYAYCENDPVNSIDPDGRSGLKVLLKAAYKIGKSVAKHGASSLNKAATYADAFSDVTDNFQTLTSSESSFGEKLWAGTCLASEILPVSVGDAKDAGKLVNKAVDAVSDGNKMTNLRKKAEIGQEAHRQIEKEIIETVPGAKKEVEIKINGRVYRKDAKLPDGTYIIIKPDTPSGHRAARKREKILKDNELNSKTRYYDPNDPKYLPGSPTYIGPKKN